jgi:hypothetical protein
MALSDTTKSAPSNYEAGNLVSTHIIAALKGTEAFSSQEGDRRVGVKFSISKLPRDLSRAVARRKKSGQWLSTRREL